MIFTIFARFLKSYTGFDVKISFPSVFGFRCTYYEPRATENRPIDGRGGAWVRAGAGQVGVWGGGGRIIGGR